MLILIGTNDLARETPVTTIESDYQMLADMASVNKIKVIFASVLPVSDYHKDEDPTYERTAAAAAGFHQSFERLAAEVLHPARLHLPGLLHRDGGSGGSIARRISPTTACILTPKDSA